MKSIFCGKRDARAVLVLYKYCLYFRNFMGICFDLALPLRQSRCFPGRPRFKEAPQSRNFENKGGKTEWEKKQSAGGPL